MSQLLSAATELKTIHKGNLLLREIKRLDEELSRQFKEKFVVQSSLTRSLVSFQANKSRAVYRWYKYKEAFSASLIERLIHQCGVEKGKILDPFAGSGTALFIASENGLDVDGIELLPVGQQIILARKGLEGNLNANVISTLKEWLSSRPWNNAEKTVTLNELRITKGAYPTETKDAIERYMSALQNVGEPTRQILCFALLCVLESISYTRKDGQYLRWDDRSGRRVGAKPFCKGEILSFDKAICAKLEEIISDVEKNNQQESLFATEKINRGEVSLFNGSCLDVLPHLQDESYDAVITSPPYCNRYDYTRTYALELALLGADEKKLAELRQNMLSCTVENRAKDLIGINSNWTQAIAVANEQKLLQVILQYLEEQKADGSLNNNGIPRMVRGYFYEMACVIYECARVLRSGAPLIMVNDNVRYAGASVSVDMILSNFAEQLGFEVESILVLPSDKGNSSQQMGEHGRVSLRKCVYVWRKI
jgi:DNA modification methylase